MKILIVDSTAIINERLKTMISEANSALIIYQAKSYKEAMQLFTQKKPTVVVLDSGLPGNRSAGLLKEIKKVNEKTVVIILSLQINTLTAHKYATANFFLDKYHQFEKVAVVINSIITDEK